MTVQKTSVSGDCQQHDVPAHHRAEEAVEAYLAAAGLEDAKAPLFQSMDRTGRLSDRPLGRRAVLAMMGLGEQWNRKYGRRLDLGPPE